jgi:hypothetical protein
LISIGLLNVLGLKQATLHVIFQIKFSCAHS